MRRIWLVVLTLGVVFGYGSGFASLAHHARHHGHGCHDGGRAGWSHWREAERQDDVERLARTPVAPAAAPPVYIVLPPAAVQPVVVQQAPAVAPAAAPAP